MVQSIVHKQNVSRYPRRALFHVFQDLVTKNNETHEFSIKCTPSYPQPHILFTWQRVIDCCNHCYTRWQLGLPWKRARISLILITYLWVWPEAPFSTLQGFSINIFTLFFSSISFFNDFHLYLDLFSALCPNLLLFETSGWFYFRY